MAYVLASLCGITFLSSVSGHSWVECSDYDMSIDPRAQNFDGVFLDSACSGYARARYVWSWHVWGENSGIDYQLFEDGTDMCEYPIGTPNDGYSSGYNTQYPMANYRVGDTKRIIWPAKNHAYYGCRDDNGGPQLDHKMQLWVNLQTDPTSDLGNNPETSGYTLVIDWHEASGATFTLAQCTDGDCNVQSYIGQDDIPFQNCANFCDDNDKAFCYGDFVVPNIFPQDGYYSFVWYWAFKSNEIYTHCFEAYVSGTESFTGSIDSSEEQNGNSTGRGSKLDKEDETEDSVAAILWTIFAFVLLFGIVIITCLVLQKQGYIVCTENSIIWNGPGKQASGHETGLVGAVHGPQVISTTDGRPSTTGPPPPPPPPVR